jgi:hypothetical protein
MTDILNPELEKALFNMNKYGLKPPIKKLEELAKREFIDISQDDGWIVSTKGHEYLKNMTSRI